MQMRQSANTFLFSDDLTLPNIRSVDEADSHYVFKLNTLHYSRNPGTSPLGFRHCHHYC